MGAEEGGCQVLSTALPPLSHLGRPRPALCSHPHSAPPSSGCLWLAGLAAVATSPRRCTGVRLVCGVSRRWGGGIETVWPRWSGRRHLAPAWSWRLPRTVYKYISLKSRKGSKSDSSLAARCCLPPPLLSTRRRYCCPPGSVPKGVVLEGRCPGSRLTVRGQETSFLERRRHPATSTGAASEAAAAFQHLGEWTAPTQTPRVTLVGA